MFDSFREHLTEIVTSQMCEMHFDLILIPNKVTVCIAAARIAH